MTTKIRFIGIGFIFIIFLVVACSAPEIESNTIIDSTENANVEHVEDIVVSELEAVLSEIEGFVEFREIESVEITVAKNDDSIQPSGQVITGDDGRVRLTFSDGSIIRLGPNSQFTFEEVVDEAARPTTKIRLDWGALFIILQGGSLDVDTDSGVASVRGSYMEVRIDPDTGEILITCLEGDCSVETEGGTVSITAGQSATIKSSDLPPTVGEMTVEDILRWLQNNPEATAVIVNMTATVDAWKSMTQSANPTQTLKPDEPTPTPTPTLGVPQITITGDYVCKNGPGSNYNAIGTVFAGQTVNVVGQNNNYWVIEFPSAPGVLCWVPKANASPNEWAGFVPKYSAPPENTVTPKPTRPKNTPTSTASKTPIFTKTPGSTKTPGPTKTPEPTKTPVPSVTPIPTGTDCPPYSEYCY